MSTLIYYSYNGGDQRLEQIRSELKGNDVHLFDDIEVRLNTDCCKYAACIKGASTDKTKTSSDHPHFREVVRRACEGSEQAIRELVEAYGPHIQRVIRHNMCYTLRSNFDSLDILQMVWVSFFTEPEKLAQFREPSQLIRYLARMGINMARDGSRRRLELQAYNVRYEQSLDLHDGPETWFGSSQETPARTDVVVFAVCQHPFDAFSNTASTVSNFLHRCSGNLFRVSNHASKGRHLLFVPENKGAGESTLKYKCYYYSIKPSVGGGCASAVVSHFKQSDDRGEQLGLNCSDVEVSRSVKHFKSWLRVQGQDGASEIAAANANKSLSTAPDKLPTTNQRCTRIALNSTLKHALKLWTTVFVGDVHIDFERPATSWSGAAIDSVAESCKSVVESVRTDDRLRKLTYLIQKLVFSTRTTEDELPCESPAYGTLVFHPLAKNQRLLPFQKTSVSVLVFAELLWNAMTEVKKQEYRVLLDDNSRFGTDRDDFAMISSCWFYDKKAAFDQRVNQRLSFVTKVWKLALDGELDSQLNQPSAHIKDCASELTLVKNPHREQKSR